MTELKVRWDNIVSKKPIVEFINLGNGTQFKIISFYHRSKLFVALERLGSFFFDCERFKSGEYVSEKLNICLADANIIADWINCQLNTYDKQQGYYSLNYLKEDEIHSCEEIITSHAELIDFHLNNYPLPLSPIILNHE